MGRILSLIVLLVAVMVVEGAKTCEKSDGGKVECQLWEKCCDKPSNGTTVAPGAGDGCCMDWYIVGGCALGLGAVITVLCCACCLCMGRK